MDKTLCNDLERSNVGKIACNILKLKEYEAKKKGALETFKKKRKKMFHGNCKNLACMLRPLKKRQSGTNHCYLMY